MSQQNDHPEIRSYFKISDDVYGQRKVFRVKFEKGEHTELTYEYNHDAIYDNAIGYLETLHSWNDSAEDVSDSAIPSYARRFVKVVS